MKVLITGATGFIGSALARAEVNRGSDVHALVRDASSERARGLAGAGIVLHDVGTDPAAVGDAIERARPDLVYHLATSFNGGASPNEVTEMVAANILFGTLVLDAVSRAPQPPPVVVTSSAYQHVDGLPYRPVSLYAASKHAFEAILEWYSLDTGVRATVLVLFDSYGPGDPRRKLVPLLLEALRGGTTLRMSSGSQLIALTYIDDVVSALTTAGDALAGGADGIRRMVRPAAPCSVREVATTLEAITGRRLPVEWGATPERPHEMREPWNVAPMLEGWEPSVPLPDGLGRTWADLEEGAPSHQ